MKRLALTFVVLLSCVHSSLFAQTPAPRTPTPPNTTQLQELTKRIEEQNAKIDTLSQQILKLEQQIANMRPGVMIGEATPSPSSSAATGTPTAEPSHSPNGGSTHTVARGETLTSIAKMYSVSVSDLQKYNHIDNPLKLQAGQTIAIPASPAPSASPSSSPE